MLRITILVRFRTLDIHWMFRAKSIGACSPAVARFTRIQGVFDLLRLAVYAIAKAGIRLSISQARANAIFSPLTPRLKLMGSCLEGSYRLPSTEEHFQTPVRSSVNSKPASSHLLLWLAIWTHNFHDRRRDSCLQNS
jgi:hypothetical protein